MVKNISSYFFLLGFLISCATQQTAIERPNPEPERPTEVIRDSVKTPAVVPLKRVWDADEISEYISAQNSQITVCYESLKIKKASASGEVVVRFRLVPSGKVDSFFVVSDKIRDENLVRCIKNHIMRWSFQPVDSSNQSIWLEVPYDFTDFYAVNKNLRSDEECSDVITQNKNQLRICFSDFDASAELTIEIIILPGGKVDRVILSNSSISGTEVEDCLIKKIKSWVFSKIPGDELQSIKFSYIYSK